MDAVFLRTACEADREFLLSVYASTRLDELACVPWSEAQKAAFLRMQFDAQDADYRSKYPPGDFQVLLSDGIPAGRLILHHAGTRINIVDISILPEFRGRKIGSHILADIVEKADTHCKAIVAHVEKGNRARGFYSRFGFQEVEDLGVYLRLHREPAL